MMLALAIIMIAIGQVGTAVAGMMWPHRSAHVLGLVAACVLIGAVFVGRIDG